MLKFFPNVIADLTSHANGPGFFTLIAGTCVFGSQLIIVAKQYAIARYLWFLAIFLWVIIIYTFFTAVTMRKNIITFSKGNNVAYLIAVIAIQPVAMLATLLSPNLR